MDIPLVRLLVQKNQPSCSHLTGQPGSVGSNAELQCLRPLVYRCREHHLHSLTADTMMVSRLPLDLFVSLNTPKGACCLRRGASSLLGGSILTFAGLLYARRGASVIGAKSEAGVCAPTIAVRSRTTSTIMDLICRSGSQRLGEELRRRHDLGTAFYLRPRA